jgi:hypothetical protein
VASTADTARESPPIGARPFFRPVDAVWALVAFAYVILMARTMGVTLLSSQRVYSHAISAIAYLVLPYASVLLLLARRFGGRRRILALWGASALAGLISYTVAFVLTGVLLAGVLVPVLLLPVALYVYVSRAPRPLPVIGLACLLLALSFDQPFVSIVVFVVAAVIVWDVRRHSVGAS